MSEVRGGTKCGSVRVSFRRKWPLLILHILLRTNNLSKHIDDVFDQTFNYILKKRLPTARPFGRMDNLNVRGS